MTTTNLVGTGENTNSATIANKDVSVKGYSVSAGFAASGTTGKNLDVDSAILGVDINSGSYDTTMADRHVSTIYRTISPASGYNANGTPDWGDGVQSVSGVWGTDDFTVGAYAFPPSGVEIIDF
ncbi:MAG: hypothetical protein WC942_01830 [Clostridia bacterium]|jgi:hypothetical protein